MADEIPVPVTGIDEAGASLLPAINPAPGQPIALQNDLRKTRERRSMRMDPDKRQAIAERIVRFYNSDVASVQEDRDRRLQRHAKYRQWRSGSELPWPDSSDQAVPDMTTASMATQDTLHNAVMSFRPAVAVKAVAGTGREEQERKIDTLLDAQFFEEQRGELILGDMIEGFVNDPSAITFQPWIREDRRVVQLFVHPRIPNEQVPTAYFTQLMKQRYGESAIITKAKNDEGWDWEVRLKDEDIKSVSFYTRAPKLDVEMEVTHNVRVFDGPRCIPQLYDDILTPPRAANLQYPSQSNPGGASHVIMVDRNVTVDEIDRLRRDGFYDKLTTDDIEEMKVKGRDTSDEPHEQQRDAFDGTQESSSGHQEDRSHKTLTRLTCFDMFDLDGNGVNDDVIFWVCLETRTLMKAKRLTEMYPVSPPRRPFSEAAIFPVPGRRNGISLLELVEGLHDWKKETVDQMVDAGTVLNSPFFFYRAASNMKPEVLRPWPGDGIPLADPTSDVFFPQLNSATSQSWAANTLGIIQQEFEKLTLIGDIQLGRIPAGKSSAFRTASGIQTVLGQGEARPERILRRFFTLLSDIFRQYHELNQVFLPEKKKFRVLTTLQPEEDPYKEIDRSSDLQGAFEFTFTANIQNASRGAKLETLQQMAQIYVSPIAIETGVSTPDTIYRLFRDLGEAWGENPESSGYLSEPTPGAGKPPVAAEEAIADIMDSNPPQGPPLEGGEAHLTKLLAFLESDEFGFLTPGQEQLFRVYLEQVRKFAAEERRQQQLTAAAAQFQQSVQAQGANQGRGQPQGQTPLQQPNEFTDGSLPGGGGRPQ